MVSFPYFFSLQVFPGLDSKRAWSLSVHQVQTEGRGHSMGPEACLSVFACVSFVFSPSFPPLSPHTHTPTPHPHPGVMEAKPWGKGPSLSHKNLGPKSTGRIPVAFVLSLSPPFLAQKAATVAEMHSRANILKSTYLVQEPEGQFLWVGKWYRDCREEIKKKKSDIIGVWQLGSPLPLAPTHMQRHKCEEKQTSQIDMKCKQPPRAYTQLPWWFRW